MERHFLTIPQFSSLYFRFLRPKDYWKTYWCEVTFSALLWRFVALYMLRLVRGSRRGERATYQLMWTKTKFESASLTKACYGALVVNGLARNVDHDYWPPYRFKVDVSAPKHEESKNAFKYFANSFLLTVPEFSHFLFKTPPPCRWILLSWTFFLPMFLACYTIFSLMHITQPLQNSVPFYFVPSGPASHFSLWYWSKRQPASQAHTYRDFFSLRSVRAWNSLPFDGCNT